MSLARGYGISEAVIGLTIITAGTSIWFDDYRLDLGARLLFGPDGGEIELTTAESTCSPHC